MTTSDDETNVDSSLPTINHESEAPDASNTGKELKPCPFCGKEVTLEVWEGDGEVVDPPCIGDSFTKEEWNNAWAHNRIKQLEEEVESQKLCCTLLEQQRAELQERNGEHEKEESRLNRVAKNYMDQMHRLAGLNEEKSRRIADLEKRNEQLKTFIQGLKEVAEGKQSALEHANVVAGETFEALKESQSEQVKSFDKIQDLEKRNASMEFDRKNLLMFFQVVTDALDLDPSCEPGKLDPMCAAEAVRGLRERLKTAEDKLADLEKRHQDLLEIHKTDLIKHERLEREINFLKRETNGTKDTR